MEGGWLKPSATTPGSGRQGPFLDTPWRGGTPPPTAEKGVVIKQSGSSKVSSCLGARYDVDCAVHSIDTSLAKENLWTIGTAAGAYTHRLAMEVRSTIPCCRVADTMASYASCVRP